MNLRRLTPVLAAVALASVAVTAVSCQQPRDTVDVLLVGNSYIYFNNLPGLIEAISTGLDGPVLRARSHAHGGMTLRGHIDDGHLPGILSAGPEGQGAWDVVVLQEQSTLGTTYDADSGTLGSPEAFHDATRELAGMITTQGTKAALYMTWAKQAFPTQSEALSEAYRSIGAELDLTIAMVGEAWAEARRRRPDLGLYVTDGSHPSAAGSYLAACVIYAAMTGWSPVGAPRELTGAPWDYGGPVESAHPTVLVSLSPADAEFLQRTAWDAVNGGLQGR